MADNVTFQDVTLATPISSTVVATDNIAGVNHQRVKVEFGDDGTATDVSATNPLPVVLTTASSFIGHVITDNTSTTIATQATAANLNATVIGTGTFGVQVTSAPVIHVIADSGTITTVGAVTAITNPLPAGSNVIGHVIADTGSTTAVTGNVTVVQATAANLNVTATLATGASVIGHVITDTGSTTAVTQATAANLNATVVGTGTFAVQAVQSGNWTARVVGNGGAVLDGVNTAATAPANGLLGLGIYNSTEPGPTTGQSVGIQLDAKGRQRQVIMDAAGNTRGVNVTAGNAMLIDGSATTQPVSGSVTVTQATAANLNAQVVGTGTAGSAATGVVTIQGIASMTKLLVTPDANSAINLAQVGGTTVVNGGVAGSQSIGGTVATNVAITANPVNLGAQAVSSENSAVTTARQVQLVADLVGKLIVLPYANPENFVSGAITTAIVGTTSTSLIAAPASGLRNYITQITVSNSNATVGTDVVIQDGSGGTTLYVIPAAPAYGGATLTFPTPLRQPTTATAIFMAAVTTGAGIKVSASGYKGA